MLHTKDGPLLLCILDGYGLRNEAYGNAIKAAKTPTLDKIFASSIHSKLRTDGESVGLPEGQMGNSEVGHMTIGAGRPILQNLPRIQRDLEQGNFTQRPQWQEISSQVPECRAVHLVGLVSNGGVHSHTDHLIGLCKLLSSQGKDIFIHMITDGRDTAPQDLANQLTHLSQGLEGVENVYVADICGRFYAMDRDQRWDRTQEAYKLYTEREVAFSLPNLSVALQIKEQDEFIKPTAVDTQDKDPRILDGDGVIFFNFRADRMRQIVQTFVDSDFPFFMRDARPKLKFCATMTNYGSQFDGKVTVIYPAEIPTGTLGEAVAQAGKKQLRIAESEKYAHVTYFLDGGKETNFPGMEKIIIPSPKVSTYDQKPEMSLDDLSGKLCAIIKDNRHDLIVLNIANPDMVGHTGNFQAAIRALEAVDKALSAIWVSLNFVKGELILIADHGNCEEMMTKGGKPCTSHTKNPVPFVFNGRNAFGVQDGTLADVAPTVLELLGVPTPPEMEGSCLLTL